MNLKFRISTLILQYRTLMPQPTNKLVVRTIVNLSFKVIGKGTNEPEEPPIFLFHGLLGNKKLWKGMGKTILNMTKRSVVIVDLRNHGTSPHTNSHKYDDMAADILHLLHKLEVRKASLVGHSMGGRAAMCVSLTEPQKVAGILVIDISPVSNCGQIKHMTKMLTAMKELDFKNPKKLGRAKKEVKKQLREVIDDEEDFKAILSNVKILSNGKIGWGCNLDALIKQSEHIATFPKTMKGKTYSGPCLFIGGQVSDCIPPDDLTKIRELFPSAVVKYIPKTGHNLHADDPKSFLELAIAFLKTHQY